MKKIAIVTDVWLGVTSGVTTAIKHKKRLLEKKGFKVLIIHPGPFFKLQLPIYKEIKFAYPIRKMKKMLKQMKPDYIHIETEGPIGLAARQACVVNNWKFTTSYHTRVPEYLELWFHSKMLKKLAYKYFRWFHSKSQKIIASTSELKRELEEKKFKNLVASPLGVDINHFKKNFSAKVPKDLKKPIFVYLGRIAAEKNIMAFLNCDLRGSKLLIGDGPQKKSLQKKYKGKAIFVGYKKGTELVDLLSISDVLVFPSRTDSFGLVILEALACGVPIAAYDVRGPKDLITNGVDGFLGDNLEENAKKCLKLHYKDCRNKALKYSWEKSISDFIKHLVHV